MRGSSCRVPAEYQHSGEIIHAEQEHVEHKHSGEIVHAEHEHV